MARTATIATAALLLGLLAGWIVWGGDRLPRATWQGGPPVAVEDDEARALRDAMEERSRLQARLGDLVERAAALEAEPAHDPLQRPLERLVALAPKRFKGLTRDELAHLRELDLSGTEVTNDDLALLAPLERLRTLVLRGTAIGDAGLDHLDALPALARLELGATGVTEERVRRFAEAHPDCNITSRWTR